MGEHERDDVKQLLDLNYKKILALYKVLSADNVNGQSPFGISQLVVSEAVTSVSCGGDSATTLSDLDRLFIGAKVVPFDAKKVGAAVRNDTTLVRHQFLEFCLRLASQRFYQPGICKTM